MNADRNGEFKIKHFIIPLLTLSFLQINSISFRVPTSLDLCLSSLWLLPSFFSCIALYMKPYLYSGMQHLPCSSLYSFSFTPHCILCSPRHYDIWLSTVTHPLCCKAAIDYSSLCAITSFRPQWAVHIILHMYLCQGHFECWLCSAALPSLLACHHLKI